MKTAKNVFLLLFTLATLTVNGQNHLIGVTGSVNWTNVTANNNFASDLNYRTGFAAGFSYDYIFKKNFIIGADILYNQRGFTTITNSDYFANLKIRHNGMAINIGLKYALTK